MAIDDIVGRIEGDAQAEAAALLDAARADAEKVVADAAERAEAKAARAADRARSAAEREASTMLAAARLGARDRMLGARQDEVKRALAAVEEALVALPDADYASMLAGELGRTSLPQGSLYLGTADAARLRAVLPAALQAAGVEAQVSDELADVERGIVLLGDRVRIEFSPASIVDARRGELEAEIDRGLFREEG